MGLDFAHCGTVVLQARIQNAGSSVGKPAFEVQKKTCALMTMAQRAYVLNGMGTGNAAENIPANFTGNVLALIGGATVAGYTIAGQVARRDLVEPLSLAAAVLVTAVALGVAVVATAVPAVRALEPGGRPDGLGLRGVRRARTRATESARLSRSSDCNRSASFRHALA